MVIKLISEGKANFLDGCKGPFTIGDDLSAIADIKKIDLSSLGGRLQGEYEALTAETITNLNPLTPLPILRLFRPAGTLDALANCTALTDLNLFNCGGLEGQSYARSASPFFNLHCKPPRPPMQIY